MTPDQVEADYEAGPNSTSATAGALSSIQFSNSTSAVVGGKFSPTLIGTYASLTNNVNISTLSGITYTSDNTNIVSFGTDGSFHAVAAGSTTIRASYLSKTAALAVTVNLEPAVIVHRYGFNEAAGTTTITDSVGAANGTLVNGTGTATLDGAGKLTLDGNNSSAYVSLPPASWAPLPMRRSRSG